jgi:hypothetical protein
MKNLSNQKKKFIFIIIFTFIVFNILCYSFIGSYTAQLTKLPKSSLVYSDDTNINDYAWVNFSKPASETTGFRCANVYATDSDPNTWYATQPFNISTTNPLIVTFEWPIWTNCCGLRFYYYEPTGERFYPTKYEIYATDISQHSENLPSEFPLERTLSSQLLDMKEDNYTIKHPANGILLYRCDNATPCNDAWTIIHFSNATCKKLTWEIDGTLGMNPTQVVINEVEVIPSQPQHHIQQGSLPYFTGISRFWNNLDWALSWHIDDVTSPSLVQSGWLKHQPLTLEMMGNDISCPSSYITHYHVEYGSHSIDHSKHGSYSYAIWFDWVYNSIQTLEKAAPRISLWSNKCISFSVPFSSGNHYGAKAAYDAGIRIMGNYGGKYWKIRNPRNIAIEKNNILSPQSDSNWMFLAAQGGKPDVNYPWRKCLLQAKENHSFADIVMHQNHPKEHFDPTYYSFIENDTTAWHCTWGEMRSYEWYRKYSTVTYNGTASTSTKKVFDTHINSNDDRIWEVPITLAFDIPRWNGKAVVRWEENGTIYKDTWDNIGGFFPSSSQHTNQTMREGYRWDGTTLYLSTKLKGKVIELGVKPE